MTSHAPSGSGAGSSSTRGYNLFLLLVAGLGGLLYGVDVGIIGGALPYLEATSRLNPSQLSVIVAAVLLGSVFSTLFAGMLADWMGRKPLMILSGLTFVVSIPVIALSHGFGPLFFGRLLQGMSGGLSASSFRSTSPSASPPPTAAKEPASSSGCSPSASSPPR